MVAIIIIVVDAITRIIMIDMLWYIIMDSRSNYKVWVDLPSSVFNVSSDTDGQIIFFTCVLIIGLKMQVLLKGLI